MATKHLGRWALTLVVAGTCLCPAGEPVGPDDREIPPDRGRLFIKDPKVLRARLRNLKDASLPLEKRFDALSLFVLTREWDVVPELVKLATNESQPVELRVATLWALGEIGDPRGMPALQYALSKLLKDPQDPAWAYEQGIEVRLEGEKRTVPLREMLKAQLARLGEPVVDKLAKLLRTPLSAGVTTPEPELDKSQAGRMRAALVTLVAVGDRDVHAVETVMEVLTADDKYYPWDFKVTAAEGLGSLLRQRAQEFQKAQGVEARDELGRRIADALIEACIVTDVPEVREVAGRALRDAGMADRAGRRLAAVLEVPNIPRAVRYRTIEALFFVGSKAKEVADQLIFMLYHRDRHVRWRAAMALAGTGDPRAVRFIRPLTQDPDAFVRMKAIAALGHMRDPAALPDLVVGLEDRDAQVRRQAARALGRLAAPATIPALVKNALTDPAPSVRQEAIIALGYIGRASGLRHVAEMIDDPHPAVRLTAVEVLEKFLNPGATRALAAALADTEPSVREAAAEAVHNRLQEKPRDVARLLVDQVADGKSQARLGALSCLAEDYRKASGPKGAERKRLYLKLAKDPSSPLAAALIASLKDEDPKVRSRAVGLLARIGWEQKSKELLRPAAALADDPAAEVRAAAARARNFLSNLK
ncbi:MAG: HEAT repeat domain-containing protein [Candidatus Brocadiia bacterium]